jgi:hypothetical protein
MGVCRFTAPTMKPHLASGAGIALLAVAALGRAEDRGEDRSTRSTTWTFETDRPGKSPAGFSFARTGEGKPGTWVVRNEPDAPSGKAVLAQIDRDDTDYRFPLAIAEGPPLADLRLSVRCKPVDGKVDQACGLIFRFKDENNYYITRANALENNVRLYHVADGRRVQFAGWNGKVAKNVWHQLEVQARGDRMVVSFDGSQVIDARDGTFSNPGKIGVWTKADSMTFFDDLSVTPLH